jgi:hypothetical protein
MYGPCGRADQAGRKHRRSEKGKDGGDHGDDLKLRASASAAQDSVPRTRALGHVSPVGAQQCTRQNEIRLVRLRNGAMCIARHQRRQCAQSWSCCHGVRRRRAAGPSSSGDPLGGALETLAGSDRVEDASRSSSLFCACPRPCNACPGPRSKVCKRHVHLYQPDNLPSSVCKCRSIFRKPAILDVEANTAHSRQPVRSVVSTGRFLYSSAASQYSAPFAYALCLALALFLFFALLPLSANLHTKLPYLGGEPLSPAVPRSHCTASLSLRGHAWGIIIRSFRYL